MNKLTWVNVLHWYQPPWQQSSVIHQVYNESYDFLLTTLERERALHLTLNIAGTLLDQLANTGYSVAIIRLKRLIARGQIEVTGTAQNHALLPLIPDAEIHRQIVLNERSLKKFLGQPRPRGFFCPELAYTPAVGKLIRQHHYQWVVVDSSGARTAISPLTRYQDTHSKLTAVFYDHPISQTYPPEYLYIHRQQLLGRTIVTVTDGELYGHRHQDWQHHLRRLVRLRSIETITVSEYLTRLRTRATITIRPSSWADETSDDVVHPFRRWNDPHNPIHTALWKLATLAISECEAHPRDPSLSWAYFHLDQGLSSCTWWWASGDTVSVFGHESWNPDEVEHGARELITSIRALQTVASSTKIKAERYYTTILTTLWEHHWKHHE